MRFSAILMLLFVAGCGKSGPTTEELNAHKTEVQSQLAGIQKKSEAVQQKLDKVASDLASLKSSLEAEKQAEIAREIAIQKQNQQRIEDQKIADEAAGELEAKQKQIAWRNQFDLLSDMEKREILFIARKFMEGNGLNARMSARYRTLAGDIPIVIALALGEKYEDESKVKK